MLNQEQFFNKWVEIKGAIRNVWGNIGDEELEKTQGSLTSIYKVIKSHNLESSSSIQKKLESVLKSFDNETDKNGASLDSDSYQRKPFLH